MLDFSPLRMAEDAELRLFQMADAEEYFRLIDENRNELKTWLPWLNSNTTPQDTIEYLKYDKKRLTNNQGYTLAILYKGRIAGAISYHDIDWADRKVELGYWLGKQFQGKGLMTIAVRILTDQAFERLNLNRVEIHCATGNTASRAIPERLGFKQEGIIRQAEWLYDHFVDLAIYGMLAEEWHS